jgi:hypothetical protein
MLCVGLVGSRRSWAAHAGWKVDRSLAWLLANRRPTVRHERRADILQGLLHLACALSAPARRGPSGQPDRPEQRCHLGDSDTPARRRPLRHRAPSRDGDVRCREAAMVTIGAGLAFLGTSRARRLGGWSDEPPLLFSLASSPQGHPTVDEPIGAPGLCQGPPCEVLGASARRDRCLSSGDAGLPLDRRWWTCDA